MKYQVFRNFTVELLFEKVNCIFSDYSDVSNIDPYVDRYIWFYLPEISFWENNNTNELSDYLDMLEFVLTKLDINKTVIVFTAKRVFNLNLELRNIEDKVESYNNSLYNISKKNKNVVVFDFFEFLSNYPISELVDFKYYFTSRIIINPKLSYDFRKWFFNGVARIEGRLKKCVVLDLDNTLWGGVLGEDGVTGIKIKGEYPGNIYEIFQNYLLELSRLGVMLTICSKNNEEDVKEVFVSNKNLILNLNHFVDWEINWNNKADNIVKLAERLNIGFDSMVFIDDNPMERELVKQEIPGIEVPDFPNNLYQFPDFLKNISNYFITYNITNEDLNKTIQYKENQFRSLERSKFSDIDSFIESLGIEITFSTIDQYNIDRLVQLTQKTNQFNLTTIRYSKEDLNVLYNNGAKIFSVQVKDKFGDYGIVGLVIITFDDDFKNAKLDSFLLSCRILGKGIEHSIMNFVIENLKGSSINGLNASYIQTNKNSQVMNFYDQFGFEVLHIGGNKKEYKIDITLFTPQKKYNHKINIL